MVLIDLNRVIEQKTKIYFWAYIYTNLFGIDQSTVTFFIDNFSKIIFRKLHKKKYFSDELTCLKLNLNDF